MSGITLGELEYSWFAERSGLNSSIATVNDHKYAYFVSKGFGTIGKSIRQMEQEWLRSVAGASGSGSAFLGDLWREACVAQSATVGHSMEESKRNFYSQVAGSP